MSEPTPPTPPAPETPTAPATPPVPAPTATTPAAPAPGGPGRGGPPKPGGPRPGGANRGFPQGNRPPREKPLNPGGAPPVLRDFAASKPNKRELDAMIEDELSHVMMDFDVATAVAQQEMAKQPQAAGAPGQRKKGRVVGI